VHRGRSAAALAVLAGAIGALACAAPAAVAATALADRDAYARVDATRVTLGNAVAERSWSRSPFETVELLDKRAGGRSWSSSAPDFTLTVAGAPISAASFELQSVSLTRLPRHGIRATMSLVGTGVATGLTATRTADVYPGIAGFRTQTTLTSTAPLPLDSATLDQAAVGTARPTIRAFRAGADWRSPGWKGPPLWPDVGGDFRKDTSAPAGGAVEGNAEWIDASAGGRDLFMAMERNDLPSSRAKYDSITATVGMDYTRDVIDLGPFEGEIHVQNPAPNGGRTRTLMPGRPFALEAAFTGFGLSEDDAGWQWQHYLASHRIQPWTHDVVFNTNNVTTNPPISTGSKDGANLAAIQQLAPIARRLGITTFVLDNGWQAASGDWYPDSPSHPEPRHLFPPRFPDDHFAAVHRALGSMKLGLWMSPLNFNPAAQSFHDHPEWVCHPISDALVAYNESDPNSGSNDAGLPEWSTAGFAHVESRIRNAIVHWGVRYFKFDFMAWLDCAGANDLYEHHDALLAMVDRLRRDFPTVTFQMDETNDYRSFPFESTMRGPTWFQNWPPDVPRLLHNIWVLSPYVPAYTIGQAALDGEGGGKLGWHRYPVGTLMAAALPTHVTFWRDLRTIPGSVIRRAARWVAFYKRHRGSFSLATFPLLGEPLDGGWTALQEWNPDSQRGALLVFRQNGAGRSRAVRLRLVRPGLTYRLVEAPSGRLAGVVTSAQLRSGLRVKLVKNGARVLLIDPVGAPSGRQRSRTRGRDRASHQGQGHGRGQGSP